MTIARTKAIGVAATGGLGMAQSLAGFATTMAACRTARLLTPRHSRRIRWRHVRRETAAMPTLPSKLNPRSEEFKTNAAAMRVLVDDLNAKLATIAEGGGEAARAKHLGRGKLLPRERVQ